MKMSSIKFYIKKIYKKRIANKYLQTPNVKEEKFPNVEIMSSVILSGNNEIGEHTYIGFNSSVTESKIGRYCSIAPNVHIGIGEHKIDKISTSSLFYKNPFETLTEGNCIIGNDVWIGVNVVVRRGVTVGDGAVIGANSFVNKNVQPFEIIAGTPAKFIRMRFSPEQIHLILESKWWNYDIELATKKINELENSPIFNND